MGSDIHSFVEQKTDNGWVCCGTDWHKDRNYRAFALLSGIRNYAEINPISSIRGLPDDISDCVRHKFLQDATLFEVHSASWVTLSELLAVDYEAITGTGNRLKDELCGYFFNEVAALHEYGEPDAVRVVFWFDC